MQLIPLAVGTRLSIGPPLKPLMLQQLVVSGRKAKESDLEDLIVEHPALLNTASGDPRTADVELLIIDRQPFTTTQKRPDLLALHSDGSLVVVEVKRDAKDAKARREAMEFQAIRYAAACRKLSAAAVVSRLATYLAKSSAPGSAADDEHWGRLAAKLVSEHLEGGPTEDTLDEFIVPRERLKIYLVSSDFERDMLSACAWLREKGIEVLCFRLRPYEIGDGHYYLEREQLIPPPQLEDFLIGLADPSGVVPRLGKPKAVAADKARTLTWLDAKGEESEATEVSGFKEALRRVILAALKAGLPTTDLPMAMTPLDEYDSVERTTTSGKAVHIPFELETYGCVLDLHGDATRMRDYISFVMGKAFPDRKVRIETADGILYELPSN